MKSENYIICRKLIFLHFLFRNVSRVSKIKESYHFALGDVPLISATVGELVDDAADKSGDVASFVSAHQGISKTYAEFRKEVK